jgi:hypothetical protein
MLRRLAVPLGFAVLLAAGAAVTTAEQLLVGELVLASSLLALSLLLARDPHTARDYGAVDIITAPLQGFAATVRGVGRAIGSTSESIGAVRDNPAVRGSLIAAPVIVALLLLFAAADPLLGRGRNAVYDALSDWAAPRVIFGLGLALFVAGAYAASNMAPSRAAAQSAPQPQSRIGLAERRIVLTAAGVVSWLFVLLQLSYLFGTQPSTVGSGITFAEYARRGFGELAIAATGVGLLIVAAHWRAPAGRESELRRSLTWPSLALLAAVCCILVSAFHRVNLYEDAYGYTTARVYAQAYIMITLGVLITLAWQVAHAFDTRALARAVMVIALTAFAALVFWNGDAWVARSNIQRFAQTGKLDVTYLARELSPDAYPELARAMPALPEPMRTQLAGELATECARDPDMTSDASWYEWNLRRSRAKRFVTCSASAATTASVARP